MRQLFVTAFLFSAALSCSMPPPMECTRNQVSADGFINGQQGGFGGGFAGGTGGGIGTDVVIHLPGEPITLRMIAPLTACATDTLRATVEVLGPDSQPIDHTDTELSRAVDSHVETSVTFTPQTPGTYVARAVFEPSIGVRTTSVQVLQSWTGQGTRVALPSGVTCSKPVWPVTSDSLACERMNELISVISSDGGVTSFAGHGLVTVGSVLWSETVAGNLERRVPADGGFVVTNSWPNFGGEAIRGFHSQTTAVRRKSNTASVAAVVIDGGSIEQFFAVGDLDVGVFFYEHDHTVRIAGGFSCTQCLQSLVAFDSDVAWQQFGQGSFLSGFRRPITDDTMFRGAQHSLNAFARPGTPPQEPLERWPLWIDPGDRQDLSILIHPRSGALFWSVWPRTQVERVGVSHVVLSTDAGFVIAPFD